MFESLVDTVETPCPHIDVQICCCFCFNPWKATPSPKKIPPRILYSACPGQELHKCLATTVWNIVKHAGMSLARLFPFCYFVCLLYFCIWTAAIIWSKPQRHFGISYLRFSWVQRSSSFRTLSLPSTQNPTLLARALDNLIQLAVFHQFAALGNLDRTVANRELTKRILHFFRAPHPNLRDAQANKGKTLFLRGVSSLIFVRMEKGKASGSRRHA